MKPIHSNMEWPEFYRICAYVVIVDMYVNNINHFDILNEIFSSPNNFLKMNDVLKMLSINATS